MTKAQRLALQRIKTNHVWVRKPVAELEKVHFTKVPNKLFYKQALPSLEYLGSF